MPRLPKNYSKSLIYKLCCKDTSIKEIYVGSTTNFTQRKRDHKTRCNNPNDNGYNLKVYQYIRANGGWDNWKMILIEYFPCETELELCRREDYFIQELKAILNTNTPHIYENVKEYYQQNKEKIAERNKEYKPDWYEANKEKILEKAKEYHHAHKEQKKEYYQQNKEIIAKKKKEYCEANKEQINEKAKEYYQANKEKILEKTKKYQQANKEIIAKKQKEWCEANKEKILEYRKEYYQQNKEKYSRKK